MINFKHTLMKIKSLHQNTSNISQTVLITIDVVNGSCHPDNRFGADVSKNAVTADNINTFLGIIPKTLKCVHFKPKPLSKHDDFTATFYGIQPNDTDLIFEKSNFDIWQNLDFVSYLQDHDIKTLILTGFEILACIQYAVLGAIERNFKVIVLEDLVSNAKWNDWGQMAQQQLNIIAHLYGSVVDSQTLIKFWESSKNS